MDCPICNKKMVDSNLFFKCDNCFFISKNKNVSEKDEKERYELHQYDDNYNDYMKNLFLPFFKDETLNILDYGCGKEPVLKNVFNTFKIDIYDYYFYTKLDYVNKMYDIIVLNEVIEHLKNPFDTLKDLLKNLNVGGYFLIQTGLTDNITDMSKWWYTRDITHISFFNTKTFKYIALSLNLEYSKKDKFIILKRL